LVMANIVSDRFKSVYDDFKSRRWGRYYLTTDWWVKNPNYEDNIPLLQIEETKLDFTNLYQSFLNNPDRFCFLN
jgi:oxalate decarboxylase/phosphoglucose isomerase-like protein (cupin superfamily)